LPKPSPVGVKQVPTRIGTLSVFAVLRNVAVTCDMHQACMETAIPAFRFLALLAGSFEIGRNRSD